MFIENNQGQELSIIDDVTRILQVRNYWKSQENTFITNRPRSRINSDINPYQFQDFKLPLVIKHQNSIERNKAMSVNFTSLKLTSVKSKQPKRNQSRIPYILAQSHDSNELSLINDSTSTLPSQLNTKTQNLKILETLTKQIKFFQVKQVKYVNLVQKDDLRQHMIRSDNNTFLTSNIVQSDMNLYEDKQAQKQSFKSFQTKNETKNLVMRKISHRKVQFAGINQPYDLYIMNHSRKKMMDHMMNNLSQEWGDNSRKVFDELIKPDKQKMMNIIVKEEQLKKKNEMTSRNQLDNAYYGLKALNTKSQRSVSKIFNQFLPQDSRFYQI